MGDIFISSISINKLRNIKDLKIDISENEKKHVTLTGKNGSGKTTLLENIKNYLSSLDNNFYFGLIKIDDTINYYHHSLDSNKKQNNINLINIDEKNIKTYENYKVKYGNGIKLAIENNERLQQLYSSGEFIVSYFKAKRNVNFEIPKGVEKINFKENYKLTEKPSSTFIKYLVDLKTQQSFALQEKDFDVVNEIEEWFLNFENALKDLFNDNNLKLIFDYRNYNFSIKENNKESYGFNELSDGYSAILDIIVDLMMRMEKKSSRFYNLSGIVLIDEIETHLHIELQKRIMKFLTKLFKNIQFIVTTHSPFVLNSTENAVIYDLENKIQVDSLTNYSYEGVVEEYFNVNQYSEEIIRKINRYEELINKKEKTEEEIDKMYEIRSYLKQIPNHSEELKSKFLELEIKRRTIND